MPQSRLVSCTGFTLIELTPEETKLYDKIVGRWEGYLYILAEDTTAVLQTKSLGPVTLKLPKGLLLDGESNPIKEVLPKSFTRLIDGYATAEWVVHDYLYGAEMDPRSPLTLYVPMEEKDAVFTAAYRRGACIFGGAVWPTMDQAARNHYADEAFVDKLLQEHREQKRPVIESHPILAAKGTDLTARLPEVSRTLPEPIYRMQLAKATQLVQQKSKVSGAISAAYRYFFPGRDRCPTQPMTPAVTEETPLPFAAAPRVPFPASVAHPAWTSSAALRGTHNTCSLTVSLVESMQLA